MSPAPNWIVYNSIEYTKEEKQNLQADIPLSIQFVLNPCDRKVKAIRFLPEGLDNNLEDRTKIKIVKALKINIEFVVLPIREEKPISRDTSLIFNMWIK